LSNIEIHIFLFLLPMVLANTFHIVVVKKNWLAFLNVPLSVIYFGKNKTLRGFVVLPFFSGTLVLLFSQLFGPFVVDLISDFLIGVGLGICYLLSELPNSFVKRKLGIGNGEHSKKYKTVQMLIDKADSLVGMLIFYYFVTEFNLLEVFLLFFLALAISLSVSFILHSTKIKKSF
jgi:hypothetical protein